MHESGALAAGFLEARGSPPAERDHAGRLLAKRAHRVLALTDQEAETIAMLPSVPDDRTSFAGPRSHRIVVIPDELVVGCCGTVEHRKGADLWVAIAREVRKAMPSQPVRFVWVGEIAQPVQQDDMAGVEFVGPTANPYAHMRRFDVATLPSRDDPFPLVVLEAMLLGTPVVAFAVGGVARQIGDASIVVPPGDVAAFARAVVNLLTDEDARRRLGALAQARVARTIPHVYLRRPSPAWLRPDLGHSVGLIRANVALTDMA